MCIVQNSQHSTHNQLNWLSQWSSLLPLHHTHLSSQWSSLLPLHHTHLIMTPGQNT